MSRLLRIILPMILVLLLAGGCLKQESYPDTPALSFNNFTLVFDTTTFAREAILSVDFTDGDGNIGLSPWDTLFPYNRDGDYYFNFVISYFEKRNGVYYAVDLNPPFSGRLPLLSPDYPDKPIKGIITDTLPMNPLPLFDTIKLEVFLYDRTLKKSNVVVIPDINLRRP